MRLAEAYAGVDLSKIKEALIGGRLIVYSTGCPHSADHAIAHGAELASFAFASPTFGPDAEDGTLAPLFIGQSGDRQGGRNPGIRPRPRRRRRAG